MKKEKVAILKCRSYKQSQVDKAIQEALSLIDFFPELKKFRGKKVLIKPNVVGSFPKKQIATTTNPSIIEAVCKILKKYNCKIYIGDSPFTAPEASFKASGIDKIAKKYSIIKKPLIFEQDKLITIKDEKAKILKKFQISKTLKNADLTINIPKLKTHSLTKYTGAIKNLYGCIPGGLKQRFHLKAKGDKKFSKILVDIYQNIKPELTIIDGIIGMEGEGPTSGDAKKVNLILASKNGIAADIAATRIIGLAPKRIYAIREAVKRKLYKNFKFYPVGLTKVPYVKFKIPTSVQISRTKKLISKLFREKPITCDTKKCIKCGMCAKHCPTSSITLKPYPTFNRKTCIRCFCCMEICPRDALSLKK